MKLGWEIKKLGEVCRVERGSSPRPIEKYVTNSEDGVNWIKIGDTKNVDKYIYTTKEKITKEGALKSRFVTEGDFILSNSMSFGRPYIMKTSGYIHDGWHLLKLQENIDNNFFFYLLSSPIVQEQFTTLASGAIVKNISSDLVKKAILPIPPLAVQKRIVTVLDEAFKAIDKVKNYTEKNLQNAKELFESYLQSVFTNRGDGWEEKKLIDICVFKPQKKEARDKLRETDNVTFLPMQDLGILNKTIVGVKEKKMKVVISSYTYFANEDVLLAKITPCFENGKIGIARNLKNGIGFGSSEFIVLRSLGNVISDYLYYFLSRNQFREEGKKLMSGAVGHKRVSKEWIENYSIPFPNSTKTQQIFVQKLDALSDETIKLESIYLQKLKDLEELKKSILQKAFNGEFNISKEMEKV